MMPSTPFSYVKMSLLAFEYNFGTKIYTNKSELVHDFTFQTHDDIFTTYPNVVPPTFTPSTGVFNSGTPDAVG
jgi:hypothetical protein